MPNNRFAVFAALLLLSCTAAPTRPAMAATTPVGTPFGSVATGEVTAAGGTLTSIDGRLTLHVPAGAVAAATTLTVQSISGEGPGAVRAWRLGPEGQTFTAPVELVMAYDSSDIAGSAPEAMGVSFQNPTGTWSAINASKLDTTAKTVTVDTTHFSDWSLFSGAQLRPPNPSVLVSESVELVLNLCEVNADSASDLTSLQYECLPAELSKKPTDWAVNGAAGGTTGLGLVKGDSEGSGIYTAPDEPPSPAKVAVSANVVVRGKKMLLVSNVTVTLVAGWSGTVSFTARGSKESHDPKMTSQTTSTHDTLETHTGAGTLIFTPGNFGDTVIISEGTGEWTVTASDVFKAETTTGNCSGTSNISKKTLAQGVANSPVDSLSYAQFAITGTHYQFTGASLGGELKGVTTEQTSDTSSCGGPTSTSFTTEYGSAIPTVTLAFDGEIDPAHPKLVSGSKSFVTTNDPPLTVDMTWKLQR